MAEGNRDGLGPAEEEGSFGQEQKGRDQDCPQRVDMLERVECDMMRPSRKAVSSPSFQAAYACAASWNVIATRIGMAQVKAV